MRCPACGRRTADTAKTCELCGAELAATPFDAQRQVEVLIREAHLARVRGDQAGAIARAERVLAIYPDDPWAHLLLGEVYESQKAWAQARDHFASALKRKPDQPKLKERLANAERHARAAEAPPPPSAPIARPAPSRPAPQAMDPQTAIAEADQQVAEVRERLRLAYSRKEKAEYLLARIDRERQVGELPTEELNRLAREYTAAQQDGAQRVTALKREIGERIEQQRMAQDRMTAELQTTNEASVRGDIDLDEADARRSAARIRQQMASRTAAALREVQRAQSAVDLGGVVFEVSLTGELELPPECLAPPAAAAAAPAWQERGGGWLASLAAALLALTVFMPWLTVHPVGNQGGQQVFALTLRALAHPAEVLAAIWGSHSATAAEIAAVNALAPWLLRALWAILLLVGVALCCAPLWRGALPRLLHRVAILLLGAGVITAGVIDLLHDTSLQHGPAGAGGLMEFFALAQPTYGSYLGILAFLGVIGGTLWDGVARREAAPQPAAHAGGVPRWTLASGGAVLACIPIIWLLALFRPTTPHLAMAVTFAPEEERALSLLAPARVEVVLRNTGHEAALIYVSASALPTVPDASLPLHRYGISAQKHHRETGHWEEVALTDVEFALSDGTTRAPRKTLQPGETMTVTLTCFSRYARAGDDTDQVRVLLTSAKGRGHLEALVAIPPPTFTPATASPLPVPTPPTADKETVLRENLAQLRAALAGFRRDTGMSPRHLEDLLAPTGGPLPADYPPEIAASCRGPYLPPGTGLRGGGIPANPFVDAQDEDVQHHWAYSPASGEVRSAVPGQELY